MRHRLGYRKLNKTTSHRKAMFANMAASLIEHEQIVTTLPKAKEMAPLMDKLVTWPRRATSLPAARLSPRFATKRLSASCSTCLVIATRIAMAATPAC